MSEPRTDSVHWTVYKTGSAINPSTGAVLRIVEVVPSDGFHHERGLVTSDMRSECACGPERDTTVGEDTVTLVHQAIDNRRNPPVEDAWT